VRPPAKAIAGNLVWSTDGGVWAVWRVEPFSHANTALAEKLAVHARLRGLLVNLPRDAMLLSVCERLEPVDVVEKMAEGVDLVRQPDWMATCQAAEVWLSEVPLRRRRYYLACALPSETRGWRKVLGEVMSDIESRFGVAPPAIGEEERAERERQARDLQVRLSAQVGLTPVTAGELCWLYARAFRRGPGEPALDERWEPEAAAAPPPPPPAGPPRGGAGVAAP
jgi:hypothetical protein